MDLRTKSELNEILEKNGIIEVLEELGEISRCKATTRRLKTSIDDPEYRGWHRAMKRILVLAHDLKHTYLRNVQRGLGVKERNLT